ncbi:MAG: hypothetical protein QW165_03590 [Candidatus Woesearchaeota archaeon]
MKEFWYLSVILLMLGVLAGFSSVMTPTGAFAGNLPPQWDFPTAELSTDGSRLTIDLNDAFFDPDGDPLSFSVSPSNGVSAGLQGDLLIIIAEQSGEVIVVASDGISQVAKTIRIHRV